MSDPRTRMPPMPAGQRQQPGQQQGPAQKADALETAKETRSVFNPTDIAMMLQDGEIDPGMSVVDFLERFGIDVNGPITQLGEFFMKQMSSADPLQKMQAIREKAQPAPPPPEGDFDQVIGRYGEQ